MCAYYPRPVLGPHSSILLHYSTTMVGDINSKTEGFSQWTHRCCTNCNQNYVPTHTHTLTHTNV